MSASSLFPQNGPLVVLTKSASPCAKLCRFLPLCRQSCEFVNRQGIGNWEALNKFWNDVLTVSVLIHVGFCWITLLEPNMRNLRVKLEKLPINSRSTRTSSFTVLKAAANATSQFCNFQGQSQSLENNTSVFCPFRNASCAWKPGSWFVKVAVIFCSKMNLWSRQLALVSFSREAQPRYKLHKGPQGQHDLISPKRLDLFSVMLTRNRIHKNSQWLKTCSVCWDFFTCLPTRERICRTHNSMCYCCYSAEL